MMIKLTSALNPTISFTHHIINRVSPNKSSIFFKAGTCPDNRKTLGRDYFSDKNSAFNYFKNNISKIVPTSNSKDCFISNSKSFINADISTTQIQSVLDIIKDTMDFSKQGVSYDDANTKLSQCIKYLCGNENWYHRVAVTKSTMKMLCHLWQLDRKCNEDISKKTFKAFIKWLDDKRFPTVEINKIENYYTDVQRLYHTEDQNPHCPLDDGAQIFIPVAPKSQLVIDLKFLDLESLNNTLQDIEIKVKKELKENQQKFTIYRNNTRYNQNDYMDKLKTFKQNEQNIITQYIKEINNSIDELFSANKPDSSVVEKLSNLKNQLTKIEPLEKTSIYICDKENLNFNDVHEFVKNKQLDINSRFIENQNGSQEEIKLKHPNENEYGWPFSSYKGLLFYYLKQIKQSVTYDYREKFIQDM